MLEDMVQGVLMVLEVSLSPTDLYSFRIKLPLKLPKTLPLCSSSKGD